MYLILFFYFLSAAYSQEIPDEKWKYVNVRKDAFMFWWLYGAETSNPAERISKPLVMWIQGGPGASGTGFGNFQELGPQDIHGHKREYTWVKAANVLFVDNPVGTGFSYVTDESAYTNNVTGISIDLLTMFKAFLDEVPVFKNIPFYIFCESYGGKMTSAFGVTLYQAIQKSEIKCNFKGVALGDSWISPVDTVLTWGPYLYALSLLDEKDLNQVNQAANNTAEAFYNGDYQASTELWSILEEVISATTDNVNVYNVLEHNVNSPFRKKSLMSSGNVPVYLAKLYWQHVGRLQQDNLSAFMNGPIRKKLGIIPDDVVWGGQSQNVFIHQRVDFMKPVIKDVSQLLNFGLTVVVYEGQLDMICDTLGAEVWINKLAWSKLNEFAAETRKPLYPPSQQAKKQTGAFLKEFDNFHFYYILKAGHMVPADAPEMAFTMLTRILDTEN